jgi:hypothetical protein
MNEIDQVPKLIQELYQTVETLRELFPDRPFTLDGHLVGSLGEVIAAYKYRLKLLTPSAEGHDAETADGKQVEIKITQGNRVAFRSEPEYLIVLKLLKDGSTREIYNGPGQVPWSQAGKIQKNGQRPITLSNLRALMNSVLENQKIKKR